jgi:hypothetical protein
MRECESALQWAAVGNAPVNVLKAIATAGGPNLGVLLRLTVWSPPAHSLALHQTVVKADF